MIADRRLAKVEGSLTPTQLIALWLDEAHAFDDVDAYTAWLFDQPDATWPLMKLPRAAADAARAAGRGQPRGEVQEAAIQAAREVVFRFELVMRINTTAHEHNERETLVYTVLAQRLAIITLEEELERVTKTSRHHAELGSWQKLVAIRLAELRAAEEARATVERRYLDGRSALFPAIARAWVEQRSLLEQLADLGDRLAEMADPPKRPPPPPKGVGSRTDPTRVAALAADLVEPARIATLGKSGEDQRAAGIAERWLRPKLNHAASPR